MNHQQWLRLIFTLLHRLRWWKTEIALRLIGLRQVAYETAASPLQVQFAWAVYIYFFTIVAIYNEAPAAAQAHIHVAAHIEMVKDGDK